MSRWLVLFALALPIAAHAQDSLRIAERVGNRLDANERAYFGVLPRLDPSATVWMQPHPDGAALVIAQPGQPDSLLRMSSDQRTVLARYLDAFETEGEAMLRSAVTMPGPAVLLRVVRFRASLQPNVPVTRVRLRSGETLRGRLLWAREGRVLFWPFETTYDWRQAPAVRAFDVRDVVWLEGRTALPRLATATAIGLSAAAGALSTVAAEDRLTAAAVHAVNLAAVAIDGIRPAQPYDRIVLNGQPERLRAASDAVRPVEVFWLGTLPPELEARLVSGVETLSDGDFDRARPAPQRWHVALSTPRNVAPIRNVGTLEYAVTNTSTSQTGDVKTERSAAALQADVLYAFSTRGGVGALGLVDQRIAGDAAIGTRRLKGWEAYVYGEAYAVPLPERALPMGQRLSVGVGAGAGLVRINTTFNSGYVAGSFPFYYEIPERPEDDPVYIAQQSSDFSSVALMGRVGAEWRLTPRTSVRFAVAHHFVPKSFEVTGSRYTYRVLTGYEGTLLALPSYSIRFSHTDVNLGLRLHF